jgi:protein TonB
MLVFMTPSRPSIPANQSQAAAPQGAPSQGNASGSGASQTTPAQAAAPKPSAGSPIADQNQQATAPVAADMMNAQLAAPSRIAGQVNKPDSGEMAPDSFSPNSMDNGTNMPGPIFGSSGNLKIVPGVSAISAGVAEGMLIHRTDPVYPEFAKNAHVSGTVLLGGEITKTGSLAGLHVLSGPPVLRGPALDAVKNWRYRPYMLNNQPVEVQTTIKVIFSLDRR